MKTHLKLNRTVVLDYFLSLPVGEVEAVLGTVATLQKADYRFDRLPDTVKQNMSRVPRTFSVDTTGFAGIIGQKDIPFGVAPWEAGTFRRAVNDADALLAELERTKGGMK